MSPAHVLGDLICSTGPAVGSEHTCLWGYFWTGPAEAPGPAYLRDFVLEGQLLALHTFVEGEDESDVVGVRLPNRGGWGVRWLRPHSPQPSRPPAPPGYKIAPSCPWLLTQKQEQ